MTPSYEVNEVFVVFAVSWEENVVLLKEVLTEDETEFTGWKDRAISSVGFLKSNCGGGIGEVLKDLTACFPFEVLVNFCEFSEWLELSDGRFLETCKEAWLLA